MSLAQNYATLLNDIAPARVVDYMKSRGHVSLLPQVVRILERKQESNHVVTVARKEDAPHTPGATVVVDPRIVGGTITRKNNTLTDASYRRALVNIYKKAIHHG